MRRRSPPLGVLIGGLALIGCNSTHVGNPPDHDEGPNAGIATIKLDLQALDSGAEADPAPTPSDYTVEAAWVTVKAIELMPAGPEGCGGDGEKEPKVTLDGPFTLDLISGQTTDGDILLEEMSGDFCRLRFKLERRGGKKPDEAPEGMEDLAMQVSGSREDGVGFTVNLRQPQSFNLKAEGEPLTLGDDPSTFVVGFMSHDWLNADDLNAVQAQDTILIDETNQGPIFRDFRAALRPSARLYKDNDQDGRLNASERSRAVAHDDPGAP